MGKYLTKAQVRLEKRIKDYEESTKGAKAGGLRRPGSLKCRK